MHYYNHCNFELSDLLKHAINRFHSFIHSSNCWYISVFIVSSAYLIPYCFILFECFFLSFLSLWMFFSFLPFILFNFAQYKIIFISLLSYVYSICSFLFKKLSFSSALLVSLQQSTLDYFSLFLFDFVLWSILGRIKLSVSDVIASPKCSNGEGK